MNWGLWGCHIRFMSGCPCAIRITDSETLNYFTLQFRGGHNPGCHTRPIMSGRKSAPVLSGFKSYYSSGCDSDNVESGMSRLDFFHIQYNTLTSSSSSRRWRPICASIPDFFAKLPDFPAQLPDYSANTPMLARIF